MSWGFGNPLFGVCSLVDCLENYKDVDVVSVSSTTDSSYQEIEGSRALNLRSVSLDAFDCLFLRVFKSSAYLYHMSEQVHSTPARVYFLENREVMDGPSTRITSI